MTVRVALLALLVPLTGCATIQPPSLAQQTRDWRTVVTEGDRERLRDWRNAFAEGLRQARAAGHGARIGQEGSLLQPDAALGGGIPDSTYRCRVVKLGARSAGLLPYIAYPAFTCRVQRDGRAQSFAKLTGSQRHVGTIFPHDQLRSVFLGTIILGDEARAMQYGSDPERDVAGYVERIGENRWRLVLPYPRFESLIDVVELVPAG